MNKLLWITAGLLLALSAPAQTNEPVRLALISESDDVAVVSDALTAKLSGNSQIHLLERDEIQKVYREQGLSGGNKDYLKLGQILGADGLLLLESVEDATNQISNNPFAVEKPRTLSVRLVAVKPGLVLMAGHFSLLMKNLPDWSSSFVNHLDLFLPKLSVPAKDAIPISVVNLRSAVSSPEASEMEQQLKTLVIQRLSQEAQLFVLERQKMQLLSAEKALSVDESTFWNGAYLFDGVVDQNGFSKDAVTIDARLTPAKGGTSVLLHVSGSRTNLAEVINQLAAKVAATLQIHPTVKEWNAGDEATQYFDEAKWALRWGAYSEAQAAAESAWALGKKDLDCNLVRIRTYVGEVPTVAAPNVSYFKNGNKANFVSIDETPDPKYCEVTLRALQCYYEFSQNSSDGESRILKTWNAEHNHNSDWYQLGIEAVAAASHVLQHFNHVTESQRPAADKLAELRKFTRSVAGLISKSPSVHDSYFVGNRIATHDELAHTLEEAPNIFKCEVDWSCFWQERPEDCIALYRELMSSPAFCYIHDSLWRRPPFQPRLVAWNETDQQRLPQVWANFMRELNSSTNILLQMEAKALMVADAKNSSETESARQEWWNIVRANRDELVANNVELFYLGWKFAYNLETQTMDQEYWQKTIPARTMTDAFEKQKHYLANFAPYDWNDFNRTFESRDYTKAQAAELQPLIAAYKSNLLAQVPAQAPPFDKFKAQNNAQWIQSYLEQRVNAALNPPAPVSPLATPRPQQQTPPAISQPALAVKNKTPALASNQAPEVAAHIVTVNKFLPIPLEGLPGDKISAVTITAHHWLEGNLVLDFQYGAYVYSQDKNGNWESTRNVTFQAIAILDPATEHWQVISCPEADFTSRNWFYHHTTICQGQVFTSDGGQVKSYDAAKKAWHILDIPDVGNCELFTVNGRLYAATHDLIVEILDGGTRTHILVSNRRQPPASTLDTENLGTPALFAGPAQSLRAAVGNKIVAWENENWRTICPAPQAPMPPVISSEGILFLADGWNASAGIWRLATESDHVEFCLGQGTRRGMDGMNPGIGENSKPLWKLPPEFSLSRLPAASRGPDLYLMIDHAKSEDIVDEQAHLIIGKKVLPQNGYHAELLCFSGNDPAPQKMFLKFDRENAGPPVTGDNHYAGGFGIPNSPAGWFLFSTNYLFCGRETFNAIPSGGDPRISRPQTGVWMIPLKQIDPEIALQRKAQQEQQLQSKVESKRSAQTLLEKYDRNHNGAIDTEEREDALDDAGFIRTELKSIDTNHSGWIDVLELAYFDANQNKILDPKEQAGLDLARRFFAESLLDQFDQGGKGWLLMREYNEMIQSSLHANANVEFDLQFAHADENHDRHVDLQELENLLERRIEMQLQPRRMPGPGFYNRMGTAARQPSDSRQRFKADVEFYWQHPEGRSGPAPNQPGPLGTGWVPSGSPPDAPQ